MDDLITLILKLPRNTEITPESSQTFLASLLGINKTSFYHKLVRKPCKSFALEIVLKNQEIYFQITASRELIGFIEGQLQSSYPLITIEKAQKFLIDKTFNIVKLLLKSGNYYPIKTFLDFKDVDPLSSVLTVLSKAGKGETAVIQYALEGISSSWQRGGESYANHGLKNPDGTYQTRTDASVIREKVKHPGFSVSNQNCI